MAQDRQDQSLEEILASIKKVIAEDARPPRPPRPTPLPAAAKPHAAPDDVLELTEMVGPAIDEDAPLIDDSRAASMRESIAMLAELSNGAPPAPAPRAEANPLESMVREMLRPMLADWLDRNLPALIEQMVAREIARITGRKP